MHQVAAAEVVRCGCILKTEPKGFADRLDVGSERKKEVPRMMLGFSGLSYWKDGVFIN